MPALNAKLEFSTLPPQTQNAFLGRSASKICFLPGVEFYKFTQFGPFGPNGHASPWWFGVKPLGPGDPGLEGILRCAEELRVNPQDFARARAAVTKEWNSMSGLLVIRLLRSAWGLVGRCSSQPMHLTHGRPELRNVAWIGGAWQVYVPNLSSNDFHLISQA
jgi:hypothetical protein